MIKLEHTIFHKEHTVAFAAEASSDKDLVALDLLFKALEGKAGLKLGYINSRRLVIHVDGLFEHYPEIFKLDMGQPGLTGKPK